MIRHLARLAALWSALTFPVAAWSQALPWPGPGLGGGSGPLNCTGGTILTVGGSRVNVVTATGAFSLTCTGSGTANYGLIAGAGGGSFGAGGGGGVQSGTVSLVAGTYTGTIGTGGSGSLAASSTARGGDGGNSTFSALGTASVGGGGGGTFHATVATFTTGDNGGSGGGGGAVGSIGSAAGSGTAGQGNAGGAGATGANAAGGGGGCGASQTGGPGTGAIGGNGGNSCTLALDGVSTGYGAGGGGGGGTTAGNGGTGGGGNGALASANGSPGAASQGAGGGGAFSGGNTGGNGSAGKFMLSYASVGVPVSLGTAGGSGSGATLSLTATSAILPGDTVVVTVGNTSAITNPAIGVSDGTNTYIAANNTQSGSSVDQNAGLWYCTICAAVTSPVITVTFSGAGTNRTIGAARVSNVSSIDAHNIVGAPSTAVPSITTSAFASNREVVFGYVHTGSTGIITEGSGFTTIYSDNITTTTNNHLAYQIITTTSAVTYSPADGVTDNVIGFATFK